MALARRGILRIAAISRNERHGRDERHIHGKQQSGHTRQLGQHVDRIGGSKPPGNVLNVDRCGRPPAGDDEGCHGRDGNQREQEWS